MTVAAPPSCPRAGIQPVARRVGNAHARSAAWANRAARLPAMDLRRDCPPYEPSEERSGSACVVPYRLTRTETKNPSVSVRRGVICRPSSVISTAWRKISARSPSGASSSAGGATAKSGWRAEKAAHLVAVLLGQQRARHIGDAAARLDQRRGAVERGGLLLVAHLERAGAHPPLGVGIAPPGAGAGAGRVDQHQVGGAVAVGQQVLLAASACGPARCGRRRAPGACGSARAAACRGRWRRSGPSSSSAPRAPASCRRRRRTDRSPARRAWRRESNAASCEPSSCTSISPSRNAGSEWIARFLDIRRHA